MHDIVIRGGNVVDGSGGPARIADIAVAGGNIVEIGRVRGPARREIDADGLLVTPGWIDVHTHYDGQVFWDPMLSPSSWNGVTTALLGNCGVGFAPARLDSHDWLIELMTAIEEIPGDTLRAALPWGWETFPQYMDCLDRTPRGIDIGVLVPHGAVRAYVMGERSIRELASSAEIAAMREIVAGGLRAGALGCSMNHSNKKSAVVPGTFAADEEVLAIASAVGDCGGMIQTSIGGLIGDGPPGTAEKEIELMRRMSLAANGAPVTFSVVQNPRDPEFWRNIFAWCETANRSGARLVPQVLGRPLNSLVSLSSRNPFTGGATFEALRGLPLAERAARMRQPEVRHSVLAEAAVLEGQRPGYRRYDMDRVFPMSDPPDYEPLPERSLAAISAAEGRAPEEILYDQLVEGPGDATLLWAMMNYSEGSTEAVREMIMNPMSLLGIGDGGAHCLSLCDATTPTTILTHWVRDRTRGPRIPLERAVHEMTGHPAAMLGLDDRGLLATGRRADINLIDLENLRLGKPEFVNDLPGGGRRIIQRTRGYVGTFVKGIQVLENGQETGERPGAVIRREAST